MVLRVIGGHATLRSSCAEACIVALTNPVAIGCCSVAGWQLCIGNAGQISFSNHQHLFV